MSDESRREAPRRRAPGRRPFLAALLAAAAILAPLALSAAPASDKVPDWLKEEAAKTPPVVSPETEAVVLFQGQTTRLDPSGSITRSGRTVIRILRSGAVDDVRRLILADTNDAHVRSMSGWSINKDGTTRRAVKKDALISSVAPDTLYMDIKLMALIVPDLREGSVVGFEWEEEGRPLSVEDEFGIQSEYPVVRARYVIETPPGVRPIFHWMNYEPVEPRIINNPDLTLNIVEFKNIPAVKDEPFMPDARAVAGRLSVVFDNGTPQGFERSFRTWPELATWYAELCKYCRAPDKSVARKAQELTAGAPDKLAVIRAVARFVQRDIRYVAIQTGIGGHQPHPAPSILANRYGDCKDKATLLASLLQALGLDAYYLIVNSERGVAGPESAASLYLFNHVIVAVKLPDDIRTEGQAVIDRPGLGRLLVFDPTAEMTTFGRIPSYLQGNTVLLVAGKDSGMVSFPAAEPAANRLDRRAVLTIDAGGTLSGSVTETRSGGLADTFRFGLRGIDAAARRKFMESSVARTVAAFELRDIVIEALDNEDGADLPITYTLRAPAYARKSGKYLTLRPCVIGTRSVDLSADEGGPRLYPLDLGVASMAADEFSIELPVECSVESLPAPVNIQAGFASYKTKLEVRGRVLVYRREFILREPQLSAARFDEARTFFQAVAAEERRNILVKTSD